VAGDWIKMRTGLRDDPATFRLALMLKLDRFAIVGRLHTLWSWFDGNHVDGRVDGAVPMVCDEVTSTAGFGDALLVVEWLGHDDKGIFIPNFERHNGEPAKKRALANQRQATWRQRNADVDALQPTNALPEKSREEVVKEAAPTNGASPSGPVFGEGLSLLTSAGVAELQARQFLGMLMSSWEERDILDALLASVGKVDPRAYAKKILQGKPKKVKPPPGTEKILAELRRQHGDAVTLARDARSFWHPSLQMRWSLKGERLASV
jgi:hypothetical protein